MERESLTPGQEDTRPSREDPRLQAGPLPAPCGRVISTAPSRVAGRAPSWADAALTWFRGSSAPGNQTPEKVTSSQSTIKKCGKDRQGRSRVHERPQGTSSRPRFEPRVWSCPLPCSYCTHARHTRAHTHGHMLAHGRTSPPLLRPASWSVRVPCPQGFLAPVRSPQDLLA